MPTHDSKGFRTRFCMRPAPVLLALLAMAAQGGWTRIPAQQEPPEPQATPATGSAPQTSESKDNAQAEGSAGSEAPPEVQSSYIVRLYKVRPAKLWKGLLESLKAE